MNAFWGFAILKFLGSKWYDWEGQERGGDFSRRKTTLKYASPHFLILLPLFSPQTRKTPTSISVVLPFHYYIYHSSICFPSDKGPLNEFSLTSSFPPLLKHPKNNKIVQMISENIWTNGKDPPLLSRFSPSTSPPSFITFVYPIWKNDIPIQKSKTYQKLQKKKKLKKKPAIYSSST